MSCRRLSTLIALVVLIGLFFETVASLRVIGWQFQSGSELHTFGSTAGTKKDFANFKCWAQDATRNCNVKLYFSREGAYEPYYQIIGGETQYFDGHTHMHCKDTKWGNTLSGKKEPLMNGWAWNTCTKDWGNAFTSLYIKHIITDPPFLQGTAFQRFEVDRQEKLREVLTAGTTADAAKIEIVAHQTSDHWYKSIEAIYLYISPTIIKEYKPLYDKRTVREITDTAVKSRVIENDGCGHEFVRGMTGEITNKETLHLTSTARWEKTFDFGLTQEFTISGKVSKVTISATTTLAFQWSRTDEMTKTTTKTSVSTYVWPYHCTPGYECKYSIFKKVAEIKIPVTFTFQRGGSTFTEENKVITTAESWHEEKHVTKLATRSCTRK